MNDDPQELRTSSGTTAVPEETDRYRLLTRLIDVHRQWRALTEDAEALAAALALIDSKAIPPELGHDEWHTQEVAHPLSALVEGLADPLTAANAFVYAARHLVAAGDRSGDSKTDQLLARALEQIARASEATRQLRNALETPPNRLTTAPSPNA